MTKKTNFSKSQAQRNKKTKSTVAGSQSVSPSITYRTLHTQGSGNNLLSASSQLGYNSSAPGSAVLGYRSSPVAISSHLANRGGGIGPNGTPGTSFSQMQQHQQLQQQQQNQFYSVVKGHQGSQYPTPSVSSRNRASQSQSILRGAASYSNGNSLGNTGPYHQSSAQHSGFQSNYSLEGQSGSPRANGPGGGSSVNYPGVSTSRERERDGYGAPMRSASGIGASMVASDRERDTYASDRDSMFGGGGGIGQPGSIVNRSGSLMGNGGSRSLSLSSPMGSGSSLPSPYSNFTVQHPDQVTQSNNGNLSDQRDRFGDINRVGSESHLGGLFTAGSHSPVTSQHYENTSLGSTYDSDTRAFPTQFGGSGSSSVNNRASASIFLRNSLDSPQVLSHANSPLLFQSNSSGAGNKPKPQLPAESPTATGPNYGNFFRPGLHELEQPSPSGNTSFSNQVLPSPKFDASKYIQ